MVRARRAYRHDIVDRISFRVEDVLICCLNVGTNILVGVNHGIIQALCPAGKRLGIARNLQVNGQHGSRVIRRKPDSPLCAWCR
jgi:hypothetical protein